MERELIQWLAGEFAACRHARPGIGDDAAVLPGIRGDLVMTCDAICDGVHFRSTDHSPEQIGYKALAVNLSDLACMGAVPLAATVSLALPSSLTLESIQRLYLGMKPLVETHGIDICGGDTNVWGGPLAISVAATGLAPETGPWLTRSARPGDRILVTGTFGGSILGHHLDFVPRTDFAVQWRDAGVVRACTDVSDSLGQDLAKLAGASRVGFQIDSRRIPVSAAALSLAKIRGTADPLAHALEDGEDFELIVIASPDHALRIVAETPPEIGVTDIGQIVAERCFTIMDLQGNPQPFEPRGYQHRLDNGDARG